jgi:hypothetical protein
MAKHEFEPQPQKISWFQRIGKIVGLSCPDSETEPPYVGRISADDYAAAAADPGVQAIIESARRNLEAHPERFRSSSSK